ncbi:MAG: alpha/beta hydrolase [Erysipelotrichaceae bacterium]|jgi:alpha-beta hydrolase superfamily lysophospholipase|nr:alpha/beta hydrolase [Erysipelotrichaceae bacterium]
MVDPLLFFFISVTSIIVLFFIVEFIIYLFVFYSPHPRQISDKRYINLKENKGYEKLFIEMVTPLIKIPYEDVYITAFDKVRLHAKVYKNDSCKQVAILCHGYRASAYRDFAGIAKQFIDQQMSVILIDHRAHGKSGGHSLTFGVKEVKDVLNWIKYAKQTFGQNKSLILMGFSMGGATVLNCADKVDKDTLIIADSPYCYPREIISTSIESVHLPVSFFYPLVNTAAKIFAHADMNHLNAYEAIKHTQCKLLIIHGNKDSVVPHRLSQKLAETYPEKIQYELFEGADHGVSYLKDFARYQKLIQEFINGD